MSDPEPEGLDPYEQELVKEFLPPEQVAERAFLPTALVRLMIELGCESRDGETSQAVAVNYLHEHVHEVRAACGLPPLPVFENLSPELRALRRVLDGLRTFAEYSASRSSDLRMKAAWQERVEKNEIYFLDLLSEDEETN